MVRLPAEQALGAQAPVIDPVRGTAAHPDYLPAGDSDIHPASVRAQDTRRLHPPLDLVLADAQELVHPRRPMITSTEGGPLTPDIGNAVCHDTRLSRHCAQAVRSSSDPDRTLPARCR